MAVQLPAINSQTPAAQSAANSQRPAASSQQASSQQSPAASWPAASSQQPASRPRGGLFLAKGEAHPESPQAVERNRGAFQLSWSRGHDSSAFLLNVEKLRQRRAHLISTRPQRWALWARLWSTYQTKVDCDNVKQKSQSREAAAIGGLSEECSICMTGISRNRPLMLLLPCRHKLCKICVREIARLTESTRRPRCPFCRQQYNVAHQPPGLTQLCLDAAASRLPDADDIARLPDELKAAIFSNISNKRRVYADKLDALLSGLGRLQHLDLSGADNLQDSDMKKIGDALLLAADEQILQELDLSSLSQVSDVGVGAVLNGTTKALRRLRLCHLGQLTGQCFETSSPQRVCAFDITKSTRITAQATQSFLARMEAPQDITFRGCISAVGDGSALRTWNPTQLHRIDLNGCWQLLTEPLLQFLQRAQLLVSLDVSHCNKLDLEVLMKDVVCCCTRLSQLHLSGLDSVNDEVVELVSERLPLEHLHLERCNRVTDRAVRSLRTRSLRLQKLGLSFNSHITGAEILRLASEVTTIRMLGLEHCPKVNIETLGTINLMLGGRVYGVSAPNGA